VTEARKILVVGSLAESLVNFRGDLLRELRGRGHDVIAAAPAGPPWVDDALARWGVRRLVLPLDRTGTHPLRDAALLRALVRSMRAECPDAVLAYTIKPVVYGLLAARAAGVRRKVALITGLGFSFLQARSAAQAIVQIAVRGMYWMALRKADVVLFQNADDEQEFRRRRLISDRQRSDIVAGSGVNLDRYPARSMPAGPRRFLLIARLLIDKGVREYIEAAAWLHAQRAEVSCHLVGPLEVHPAAIPSAEIDRAVQAGAIVYHGAVRDVRPQLAAAHVYVLPSYREGMPRTVLEAMATGRPIITTDAPGCRETVVAGRNGSLVPVGDGKALAREMLRYADLPDAELRRMGEESRRLAEARFDVARVNQRIVAALTADAEAQL
jgi:glycosyltransferase involved in cell wall biosynthesis